MKRVILFASLSLLALSSIGYAYWKGTITRVIPYSTSDNIGLTSALSPSPAQSNPVDFKTEIFVRDLVVPWSILFTSPDRTLVTERAGNVRVIAKGKLEEKPLHVFREVLADGEAGLMGMAKDPKYETNQLVYFCMTYGSGSAMKNKVVRAKDMGTQLEDIFVVAEAIPSAEFHAGCRIAFGPDGMLYVTIGDATDKSLAQNKNSLAGKILRYTPDGKIPNDNPFPNSPIYSLGHRNPQGLDWHPQTGTLYATEHGPSGFDGPGGGDEINRIESGGNYGWPVVSHERSQAGMNDPLLVMTPAEAPAAGMFYSGNVFGQWKNHFFFGALKGEGLWHLSIDETNPKRILSKEKLFFKEFGRIREVTEGPDGFIYMTTSNQDGRGSVRDGDDKILRIIPKR